MKWLRKNADWLMSICLMVMVIGVFGPLELFSTNASEFWFGFDEVLKISTLMAVVCGGILIGVGLLLKGNVRRYYGVVIFAVAIALYIQGNYANINYGTLDGDAINWGAYTGYAIVDTLGWLLLLGGAIVLALKKPSIMQKIQLYGSAFVMAMLVLSLGVIYLTGDVLTEEKSDYYLSSEGMYEVSSDENIIVFVLDAFDDAYFQAVYEEDPEMYDQIFKDFTYFDNASVAAARTKAAMPAIITGESYPGEVSYTQYIKDAFDADGLYTEMKSQNYDVRIFTDSVYVPEESESLVDNQVSSGYVVGSNWGLVKIFSKLTLYRYVPHVLKSYFWIYTNEFEGYKQGGSAQAYIEDDAEFLKNMELTLNHQNNAYRFFHLNGPHSPYTLDENGERQKETSLIQQAKGSLYIVEQYIEQMRKLGVYDQATIVIMADHGEDNELYGSTNAAHGILLVKKRGDSGEYVVNSAPVSYFDLHNTIFDVLDHDTGESVFDITDTDRKRMYYRYEMDAGKFGVEVYEINGNIDEENAVQFTGNILKPTIKQQKYEYGHVLTFGPDSNALGYILSGISGTDEGNYTWTTGFSSVFQIPLEEMPQKDLRASFKVISVYNDLGPQRILVYANDNFCYETEMDQAGMLTFDIPAAYIGENLLLQLRLEYPDAVCPVDIYGPGYDQRTLALALSELSIRDNGAGRNHTGIQALFGKGDSADGESGSKNDSITGFIAKPLSVLMAKCYEMLNDYILAIIVFTLLSKIILMPVALWMQRSSITMVEMIPELNRIKAKYFGDKETISEETQAIYKKRKYNPLASTVPMIVQIVLLMGVIEAVKTLLGDSDSWLLWIPVEVGGLSLLMPLAAGFAALLLTLAQNKLAPLQKEQPKAEQLSTGLVSVGISLFLGAFVSLGTGVYWIASNLFSIPVQIVCNWIINPKKYVDYEALEASKKQLEQFESVGKKKRESYFSENKKKERADYKRFFSVVNKHLVFYSESNGFYKYFKGFIEFILEHTNMTIHYITSDPNDQIFELEKEQPRIRGYYIGENKLITLMMKMDADVVVMTMPDLENYHIKRSYIRDDIEYVNVSHGMGSNNLTFRKGALDHFDSVFCAGIHQKIEIEQQEAVYDLPQKVCVEVGYPLIDDMRKNYANTEHIKNVRKKILVAPSWQKDNIIDSCLEELLDVLSQTDCEIIVRPHPQEVRLKKEYMDTLKKKYEPLGIEIQTDFTSNNPVMEADLLITDWSDISWEYAFTTLRPVMYINTPMKVMNPEWQKIEYPPLNISLREQLGKSLDVNQLEKAAETAKYLLENTEMYRERINDLAHKCVYNLDNSAEAGATYLIKAVLKQIEKKGSKKNEG